MLQVVIYLNTFRSQSLLRRWILRKVFHNQCFIFLLQGRLWKKVQSKEMDWMTNKRCYIFVSTWLLHLYVCCLSLCVCVCVCVCVFDACVCVSIHACVSLTAIQGCAGVCVCVFPPPPTIQDLLKPLDSLRNPLLQTHTHTHTHTLFLHSSPHVCSLLRALIWLAVICFVKQWSIWLTGGALHSAHTLLWTHAGVLRQTRTKTCTGYMHMSTLRIRHGFLKISPTLPPSFTCAVEWLTEAM